MVCLPLLLSGFLGACDGGGSSDPLVIGEADMSFEDDMDETTENLETSPPSFNALDLDITGSAFYKTGNNSERVSGAPVGTNSAGTESLSVNVKAEIGRSRHGLRIESVTQIFSLDSFQTPPESLYLGVIHNTSDHMRCDIRVGIESFVARDGTEVEWSQKLNTSILGELGYADGLIYNDCVDAGSKIYFRFDGYFKLGETEKIKFGTIASNNVSPTYVPDDSRLLPLAYEVTIRDDITMLFSNSGTGARFVSYTTVIFLNSSGKPVAMTDAVVNTYLDSNAGANSLRLMNAGEDKNTVLRLTAAEFPGQIMSMRAISSHNKPLD